MKNIIFSLVLICCITLLSCNNDNLQILNSTTIQVNPSTIMAPFSYQVNPGDLDGVDETSKLRIRLLVYDEDGLLFLTDSKTINNYLSTVTFVIELSEEEEFTAIVISDVIDSDPNHVSEYWSISDEGAINTLKVVYQGSDSNYGDQEILGISSTNVKSGSNVKLDMEAAGSLICTYVKNIHAYSNIDYIYSIGNRGNGNYNFYKTGEANSNPDLTANPYLIEIDIPTNNYANIYAYKFIMPQDNYEIETGLYKGNTAIDITWKSDLTLKKGHEYKYLLELDPDGTGSSPYSETFSDVTINSTSLSTMSIEENDIINANKISNKNYSSTTQRQYMVKDLL